MFINHSYQLTHFRYNSKHCCWTGRQSAIQIWLL